LVGHLVSRGPAAWRSKRINQLTQGSDPTFPGQFFFKIHFSLAVLDTVDDRLDRTHDKATSFGEGRRVRQYVEIIGGCWTIWTIRRGQAATQFELDKKLLTLSEDEGQSRSGERRQA
jgi:hypothetical protein